MSIIRITVLLNMLFLSNAYSWFITAILGTNLVTVTTGMIVVLYVSIISAKICQRQIKLRFIQWATLILYGYILLIAFFSVDSLGIQYSMQLISQFVALLLWYYVTIDDEMKVLLIRHSIFFKRCYVLLLMLPMVVSYICAGTRYMLSYRMAAGFYLMSRGMIDSVNIQYQHLGDVMALFCFIIIPYFRSTLKQYIIVFVTLVVMFIVGTQASFVSYLFAIFSLLVINIFAHIDVKQILRLLGCGGIIVAGILYIAPQVNVPAMQQYDIYRLITAPTRSRSWSTRCEINKLNKETRKDRFVLGDYGYEIKDRRVGGYTHSIIDMMDQYGVTVMLCYLGLFVVGICGSLRRFTRSKGSIFRYPALSVLLFSIPMIFVRSSHTMWIFFPLGLAWSSNFVDNEQKIQ